MSREILQKIDHTDNNLIFRKISQNSTSTYLISNATLKNFCFYVFFAPLVSITFHYKHSKIEGNCCSLSCLEKKG